MSVWNDAFWLLWMKTRLRIYSDIRHKLRMKINSVVRYFPSFWSFGQGILVSAQKREKGFSIQAELDQIIECVCKSRIMNVLQKYCRFFFTYLWKYHWGAMEDVMLMTALQRKTNTLAFWAVTGTEDIISTPWHRKSCCVYK